MWKALGEFLFKALSAIGLGFLLRQGGKTSQKLKDTQDTLDGVKDRDAIKRKVRKAGAGAARKRMRKRDG